jgi:hypothetical protein
MSSRTSTSPPGLGAWIALGSATGLVFGFPVGMWLIEHPPGLVVALVLGPASLALAGMVRHLLTAFLAAAVVGALVACIVGVPIWIASSLGGDFW